MQRCTFFHNHLCVKILFIRCNPRVIAKFANFCEDFEGRKDTIFIPLESNYCLGNPKMSISFSSVKTCGNQPYLRLENNSRPKLRSKIRKRKIIIMNLFWYKLHKNVSVMSITLTSLFAIKCHPQVRKKISKSRKLFYFFILDDNYIVGIKYIQIKMVRLSLTTN